MRSASDPYGCDPNRKAYYPRDFKAKGVDSEQSLLPSSPFRARTYSNISISVSEGEQGNIFGTQLLNVSFQITVMSRPYADYKLEFRTT